MKALVQLIVFAQIVLFYTADIGNAQTIDQQSLTLEPNQSTFQINRHDNLSGAEQDMIEYHAGTAGWSFVETFYAGGSNYLFLLKSSNGDAQIRRLKVNGLLGPVVAEYSLVRDVSSVELFNTSTGVVLMMFQRQTGRMIVRGVKHNGLLGTTLQDTISPYLKHRDIVKPYRSGFDLFLMSVDRWHGRASVLRLLADATLANQPLLYDHWWTRGWSHLEFYRDQGETYALLYKTESVYGVGQGGKFGIKHVSAAGLLDPGWVQGPSTWSQGYTQFELMSVPTPPEGKTELQIKANAGNSYPQRNVLLIYKIHSGAAKALDLGNSGIGEQIWSGNLGIGWTDLTSFAANNQIYVAKMNEENLVPFDYTMVRTMRDMIDEAYSGKVVGYQLGIMQSGRIVHLNSNGFKNRELGLPMTTLDRQSLASVSKMVTAVTVLKMAEDGYLDLDDRMVDHLSIPAALPHEELYYLPADKLMDSTLEDVRIIELLTYTARFASGRSSRALWVGPRNAAACDASVMLDPQWQPDPGFRCHDGYQNSALGLAGFVAMEKANVPPEAYENTADWQQFHWEYWMRDAHLEGMHCEIPPGDTMGSYTACSPDDTNCVDGFRTNDVESPGYCLSGSWRGSSEDLLYFLSAMRYGKILGSDMNDLLMSKTLQSYNTGTQAPNPEGSAAIAWNSGAIEIIGSDEKGLRKAGGAGGVAAYVFHLPRNVDVALVMNTNGCSSIDDPCPSLGGTIKAAFEAAIE